MIKVCNIINTIWSYYLSLPVSHIFPKGVSVQILSFSRKQFIAINQLLQILPQEQLCCVTSPYIYLFKVHALKKLQDCRPFLAHPQTLILKSDPRSQCASNIYLASKSTQTQSITDTSISCIITGSTQLPDLQTLDDYLSAVEFFNTHLGIRVLAYPGTASVVDPCYNMFQNLCELALQFQDPNLIYLRILRASGSAKLFKELSADCGGNAFQMSQGQFFYFLTNPEAPPCFTWLINGLPSNTPAYMLDLSSLKSVSRNLKEAQTKKESMQYTFSFRRRKIKNQIQGVSFRCYINLQSELRPEDAGILSCELEECIGTMMKKLQLSGWESKQEQSIQQNLDNIGTLCDMLGIDNQNLIKRLLF